jgi:hypothetical protein
MRPPMFGAILGLLLALCSNEIMSQQKQGYTYDGHWWLSISSNEQTGFLNGYLDCYTYEHKGSDHFSSSADTYRNSVTQFYQKGQSFELNDSVPDLLHQFHDPQGRVVIDKYAEHEKGPHGGNNGLYWRQISVDSGPEVEQRGFVEGYLACHARQGHTFSKSAEAYVLLITQWYGFNRETDDIDAKREPTAIADVLLRFSDQDQIGNTSAK